MTYWQPQHLRHSEDETPLLITIACELGEMGQGRDKPMLLEARRMLGEAFRSIDRAPTRKLHSTPTGPYRVNVEGLNRSIRRQPSHHRKEPAMKCQRK